MYLYLFKSIRLKPQCSNLFYWYLIWKNKRKKGIMHFWEVEGKQTLWQTRSWKMWWEYILSILYDWYPSIKSEKNNNYWLQKSTTYSQYKFKAFRCMNIIFLGMNMEVGQMWRRIELNTVQEHSKIEDFSGFYKTTCYDIFTSTLCLFIT